MSTSKSDSKGKKGGLAAAGVAGFLLSKHPIGRAVTAITIARQVWKDPRVQKVRQRVAKQVAKKHAKRG